MLAVHAGYLLALSSTLRAPVSVMALRVTPTGAGRQDGSSWDDAAPFAAINTMVATAASIGGDVWLRADQGEYTRNGNLPITNGGTAARRVSIKGVDVNGADMAAVINGARANPWTKGAGNGAEVFRLRTGADHLRFAFLRFTNQGYGCIRSNLPHSDLLIEDCSFDNVQAFYENGSSGKGIDATVSGLILRRVTGAGWSKHFARIRYATHDALFEDCHGDAQEQDGDNFCNGIVGEGSESVGLAPDGKANGTHDVIVRRCSMGNCRDTLNNYQNGDAFGNEGQDYNWHFEDCFGWGCSDGAYDCKSRNTTFLRCGADDCKRGWRIWGDAVAIDCWVTNPRKRGGTGAACCVSTFHGGYLRWYGGYFSQSGTNSLIVAEDGGFTAYTPRTVITKPDAAPLMRVELNSVVTTIDENDRTPPVYLKSTYVVKGLGGSTTYEVAPGQTIQVDENKTFSATAFADKPFVTRIAYTKDSFAFSSEGQAWKMLRQDFEAPTDGNRDNVYEATLQLWDANGNVTNVPLRNQVNDVDDDPIAPQDYINDGVRDGAWLEVQDLSTLFTDRAGTVPVSQWNEDSDPIVRRIRDKFGFGNDAVAPNDDAGRYLRRGDNGTYWLEPYIDLSAWSIGSAGSFRFAKLTSIIGIYREPGETAAMVLVGVPRGPVGTSSNGVWWQTVSGGQSYGIRIAGAGAEATQTGNAAAVSYPLALTLQTEPSTGRSNAVDVLDLDTDVAAVAYPSNTLGLRAFLFGDGNNGQLFNGRFYGLIALPRTEVPTFQFRGERQVASWADNPL